MKRPVVTVMLTEADGQLVAESVKQAFNSGIRESEALVREIARGEYTLYSGGEPVRQGDVYTRIWTSDADGRSLTAVVSK